jgi:hypothetical protein
LQLLARARVVHDQADLLGVGLELVVPERVGERLAHGGDAVPRHARRHQQRPSQRLWGERCLHQQLVVLVGEEIKRKRHARQFLQPLGSILHDRLGLLVLQPVRPRRGERAVEHARIAVELAALHGEERVVLARITVDQLHLGAERGVE